MIAMLAISGASGVPQYVIAFDSMRTAQSDHAYSIALFAYQNVDLCHIVVFKRFLISELNYSLGGSHHVFILELIVRLSCIGL